MSTRKKNRAQKRTTRRAALIEDIATAVLVKIAQSVSAHATEQPVSQLAGWWLFELAQSQQKATPAISEASPGVDEPHSLPQ